MGFFGEKMFGKKPAPVAEKIGSEQKTEAVENTQNVEDLEGSENLENKESEKGIEENKAEETEKKEDGPAGFEMSKNLTTALEKLVNSCASGSPMDIEASLIKCDSALAEYKGKRFKDSDDSLSALQSLQKAINNSNKNFFLGMRKNTVMLQIGTLEKRINNLID